MEKNIVRIDVYKEMIDNLSKKDLKLLDRWLNFNRIKVRMFVKDYEIWYNTFDKDISELMERIRIR